jgi:prefoldin subunit 5
VSLSKYKFMESHLVQQQKGLLVKIPDISNALNALQHLMKKEEVVSCHFELADSVFANAQIKKENSVLLWLGANVMLEYNYEEAEALLTKNLNNAQVNLASLESDLAFLKDQITISEVNIARIHNYNVQLKNQAKERDGGAAAAAGGAAPTQTGKVKMVAAGTIPGPL